MLEIIIVFVIVKIIDVIKIKIALVQSIQQF